MELSILFVDDNQDILDSFKRMLYGMRKKWKMLFAIDARMALEILSKNQVDVVVSDMIMPGMNGAELLNEVKQHYPKIIRIILSGHSDQEMILQTTVAAHQYISKPCNADLLKTRIITTYKSREYLKNDKLLSILNGIGNLPTLPDIVSEIEKELMNPEPSLKKIGDIIKDEPSLIVKILQIANSGFFGLSQRISNIHQALEYLGINIVKALILHIFTFNTMGFPASVKNVIHQIGKHSIEVAAIARDIAALEDASRETQDEAYVSGILHDIGKIVLLKLPQYFDILKDPEITTNLGYWEMEHRMFGFSHEEAGAYLCDLWSLPSSIVYSTAYHHKPSDFKEKEFSHLTAVHIANILVNTDKEILRQIWDYYEKNKELRHEILVSLLPDLDYEYISEIGLELKLSRWINKIIK
jgi:HD-like signal output (HDOD) protein